MMEESTWRVMVTLDHRAHPLCPLEPQKQRQGWPIEQLMQGTNLSHITAPRDLEGGFISCLMVCICLCFYHVDQILSVSDL